MGICFCCSSQGIAHGFESLRYVEEGALKEVIRDLGAQILFAWCTFMLAGEDRSCSGGDMSQGYKFPVE